FGRRVDKSMTDIDSLLERIANVRREPALRTEYGNRQPVDYLYSPVTPDELEAVEQAMGLTLPELVRQCYLRIGNGGFGPGYGMIGIKIGAEEGHTESLFNGCLPDLYLFCLEPREIEDQDPWPDKLVPFFERGC